MRFRVERFTDVQTIGDAYRAGATIDLLWSRRNAISADASPISSGMVYLAQGHMQKLAGARFRLTASPPPRRV